MTLLKDDPTEVGGYRLDGRLGAGGMGVVYLARSPRGRTVALKVVRREWAEDREFRSRFELEVAAARMVHSRFTAPVVDADPHAPEPWMATLYVPGESLAERVDRQGPLGNDELLRLARALAVALHDIHRAGVVHRDLKPGNVLLTSDGPRVIDFGIARALDGHPLTETGQVVGTPAFMAPEQFLSGKDAGPAADVFALGCVLAFAATGRSPFGADSPFAAAYQVVHEEPDLADVPDGIRAVVADCLAKNPADRIGVGEILAALGAASTPSPRAAAWTAVVRAACAGVLRRATRPVPAWVAGVTALAVAATGGTIVVADGMPASWLSSQTAGTERAYSAPAGWRPWETKIRHDLGASEDCMPGPDAIYCEVGDRTLLRLDADDGSISWRHAIPVHESGEDTDGDGRPDAHVYRAAVELLGISDDTLLFTQHDGDYKRLRAVDTRTGETLWTRTFKEVVREIRLSGSMFFLVFQRRVEAVDLATRTVRWSRTFPRLPYLFATAHGLYLTTAEGSRTTVTALDRNTGRSQWSTTADGELRYQASTPDALYFKVPLGGPEGGALVRLDTRTREVTIALPPDPTARNQLTHRAVAQDGIVCLAHHNGTVTVIDDKTGAKQWRTSIGVRVSAPPTIVGRHIYLAAGDVSVVALDARTGEQLWQHRPRRGGNGIGPWYRSPVMATRDHLFAVSRQGSVYTVGVTQTP
ncbi:serine/threonine-protein kinase [Streptomyces sp. CA-210063]|uniref:serine/threonine-protein kinase n=1 Tax=Streptomyces sp. CA-210063 TaxID=2801029 RepID=UPI00214B1C4D|nr:serine/threonine-protein kinase [Streptomyces sp. CA-210063]UUU35800.1 serine/threonine-protein kinase [Streptomyces sp. CA-210063]